MAQEGKDRAFIYALAKGLACLETFSRQRPCLRLSQVAKANHMNLPTARRYLHTLLKLGFIDYDQEAKTYQLTTRVLRLGSWVIEGMDVRQRLLPYLNQLTRDLDVTSACAILEGNEVVYLERIRSSDVINLDLTAGSRLPVHSTALGKAIVAFLEPEEMEAVVKELDYTPHTRQTITSAQRLIQELRRIRRRRYALSNQELTLGLRSMAVPIFDKHGRVEASLGVSYSAPRTRQKGLECALSQRLLEICAKTSGRLPAYMEPGGK